MRTIGGHGARRGDWSAPASDDEAAVRAGGRRRYNRERQLFAELRRSQLIGLIIQGRHGFFDHGLRTRLAARLGVHRTTIGRDIEAILEESRPTRTCPACGCTTRHIFLRRTRGAAGAAMPAEEAR